MLSKIIGDTIVKCWSRKPSSMTDVHPTDGIYILYAITFVVYRLIRHETKENGYDLEY